MTAGNFEIDRQQTQAHLSATLDAILTLFVLVQGGLPKDLPCNSFDRGIKTDEGYVEARARFRVAWAALMEDVPMGETNPRALALEAACNEVAVATAEAGWRLAMAAGAERIHERQDG